ncbi:MAG: ESX secretion-associated protein EspG [Mycobacteriaceae bacterium]|nr:ESX secretion-associated protein EspG [Mycobacteriaceae bacterium]
MLTTTVDGLWVLQVLTGIEVVAPELGLRPHLPSVESKHLALEHPVTAGLRSAGVIDDSDAVDDAVREWLTVLSRRDLALFLQIRPAEVGEPARVLLARFAHWWVTLERSADLIRLSGAGTATSEAQATTLVAAQIDRLCGINTPAVLRPVTIDAEAMLSAATSQSALHTFLAKQDLDADQLRTLLLAADPEVSAQASLVAIQSGIETGRPTRTHVEQSSVTIIDTAAGRLLAERVFSSGKKWMIIAPATSSVIGSAINNMMRRLPADREWFSYRKAV